LKVNGNRGEIVTREVSGVRRQMSGMRREPPSVPLSLKATGVKESFGLCLT